MTSHILLILAEIQMTDPDLYEEIIKEFKEKVEFLSKEIPSK